MSGAAEVHGDRAVQRNNQDAADLNHSMVTREPDPQTHQSVSTQSESDGAPPPRPDTRGLETPPASSPCSDQPGTQSDGRRGRQPRAAEVQDEGGRPGPDTHQHPNGWSGYDPPDGNGRAAPPRGHGRHPSADKQSQTHDGKDPQEHVVLRRGFVPRTAPERVAQRKSSMAQLQQWVNQRRGINFQDDLSSPTHYFPVNRMLSSDYYSYSGGSQYLDEYPLYPAGVRPDSICSVSAVGGYDRHWTVKEKRRSLRDGGHLYGPPTPRDSWGPQYYGGMETSMRRLSIQPRSRSVPRSPSSSSGGHYSPVPPNFASPARSTSTRFDRFPGRMRDDLIYADPSVYSLRRSLSSPKYDFPGDRRSLNQGLFQHSYPVSPSIHSKMVPPFHDVYSRELHPTLKLNEIETSKLLGRLCEQNRILRDHEAVVHRLRMDKDSLEEALVATHQEMEFYQNQPLIIEKLQLKKEAHQNQLINIRGELSQASSALTTTRMEFEALEDEANAIHGDLWEQLNAGGQNELVRRHIQKEFWRVQDVLEGLHKNNSSRGTDTAKHRVTSGASGSFSTNSSASPLSSVSLTSPLSPYSSMLGCQASPTKQFGPEVSTGHSQPGAIPSPNAGSEFSPSPEVCRRVFSKPRPMSCLLPAVSADPKPRCRPRSYREPEPVNYLEHTHHYGFRPQEHTYSQPADSFQNARESLKRLNTVVEETDQNLTCTIRSSSSQLMSPHEAEQGEKISFLQACQSSKYNHAKPALVQTRCDIQHTRWLSEDQSSTDVRVGLRKDVYPDPHLSSSLRDQSPSRRLSLPESRLLQFQDSCWTDALSLHYSPDLFVRSLSSFRSLSPDSQWYHQLSSQTGTETRPLTHPDNQGELDPEVVSRTQPGSQSTRSGKVFMQTHL